MIDGRSCEKLRRRILAEHEELRGAIAKVIAARDPARLAFATEALLDRLSEHIDHEDRALEPVLREIDAWGPERARGLREGHAAQRLEIAKLRAELATAPGAGLDWAVRHFVNELMADMAAEERDMLAASVLRDDSISVELGG
jgi:hypothetical protein